MENLGGNEPQPPTKLCLRCSVQTQTMGDFCPNCGKPYVRRRASAATRRTMISLAALLVIAAVAVGATVKVRGDRAAAAETARNERLADAQAARKAERARKAAAQRAAEEAERRGRRELVREMQASITKDARNDVRDGLLDGPIYYTSCDPLGGGSTDDLTALTTTFECLAVDEKLKGNMVRGYPYSATVNWTKSSWTWQLKN